MFVIKSNTCDENDTLPFVHAWRVLAVRILPVPSVHPTYERWHTRQLSQHVSKRLLQHLDKRKIRGGWGVKGCVVRGYIMLLC